MGKKIKKVLITTGLVMMVSLIGNTNKTPFGMTAYAAEQTLNQSPRWEGSGNVWRVKDNAGGYLINSWFEDLDGSWYMLGADGIMFSGLVTDQSTGKSYLLNTNHDGTYGRMLTINGVYNINGKEIYLEFNQAHDGSYGAITSGLSEARGTGVKETGLESIPTDSAETSNNNAEPETGYYDSDGAYHSPYDINWEDYKGQDGGGATGWHGATWGHY